MAEALKNKDVAYFYDEEITNYNYGGGNPMRPHRVRLTTNLVTGYGLTDSMRLLRPHPRTREEIMLFHADDYVDFLLSVTPENQEEFMMQMRRFNLGAVGEADCPVFDGMFEYFQIYTGGSVGGAALMNEGEADIVMNWSGGMHHAKKGEASGFCYINDIVLAILELLKTHQRVLYVDIDIHHGDGVEEAFYTTDRVMTVSFHKYGDFFPGTGAVGDIGHGAGKLYAVNVPLGDGMDDESYRFMFEPIMAKVMELYQPGAIVVCGGADSLSGDKLGCFNLSLQGHSNCIEFLAKFNVPMLVLGGGGYTMRNVARCWAYETGRLLGRDLPDEIPEAAYKDYDYFMDTHRLRIAVSNMENRNKRERLEEMRSEILAQVGRLPAAPSAHMAPRPPRAQVGNGDGELPEEDMDERGGGQAYADRRVTKEGDMYASDGEDDKPSRADVDHAAAAAPAPAATSGATAAVKEEPAAGSAGAAVKEEAQAEGAAGGAAVPAGAQAGGDEAFLTGATQGAASVVPSVIGGGSLEPMQVDDAPAAALP